MSLSPESSLLVPDRTILSREDVQRHERWLTALVAKLVASSEVEDVLQDTWLAAMEQPPRRPRATRAWLARVARNFAISRWQSRRRRRRSEASVARAEAVPSTEETVDRLATFQLLLGVVRDLPEPHRTAVLLRHYHGLPVREVATRLAVSEVATRQRVKRGLDEVRRRLAERGGPGWRERLGAVLPVGIPGVCAPTVTAAGSTTASALGVLLMNAKATLGAAGILAGGAVIIAVLRPPEPPATRPPAGVVNEVPSAAAGDPPPAINRTVVESTLPPAPDAAAWSGRVLDVRGAPVPGVRVLDADGVRVAETDVAGRFSFSSGSLALPRLDPRFHVLRRHVREPDQASSDELLFVVAPSVQVGGQVSDRSGLALGAVEVTVEMRALLEYPEPLERSRPVPIPNTVTDTSGHFTFDSLPGGACRLRLEKIGYESAVVDVTELSDPGLRVELDEADGGRWLISGRVLDPAGWAVPEAVVGLGQEQVRSDPYGHYELTAMLEELEKGERAFYVGKPGSRTQSFPTPRTEQFDSAHRLERDLILPGPALTISGTVLGPDGEPAAGVVVALWTVEPLPGADFAEELAVPPEVEPHEFGIAPRRVYAVSDDRGAFTLGGLRDREYELRLLHREYLSMTSGPIAAGTSAIVLRYPADNLREMRCRVVNVDGEPMADLRIDTSMQVHRTKGSSSWDVVDDLRTDAAGTVVLPRVLRSEPTQVRVRGDDIITALEMIAPDATEPFEVVVERRCHFRIETADPRWAEATFQLETANGEMTWISSTRGTYNAERRLEGGRTPVLTASELATTLVLNETERIPISLVPGDVVVVRF